MRLKNYKDLLPSYLDGPNITRHAELIDAEDRKVYDKIQLLRDWNVLERPILIQFGTHTATGTGGTVQTQEMLVYVNTPTPITGVTFEGDISDTVVPEDDVTTSMVLKYYPQHTQNYLYIPEFTVTVTTEDGTEYVKGYPENDEPVGDCCDHDEFLDIIGTLLNAPRRRYKRFQIVNDDSFKNAVVPYLLKHDDGQGWADAQTEDDYYYKERLRTYLESNRDLTSVLELFLTRGGIIDNHSTDKPQLKTLYDEPEKTFLYLDRTAWYSNFDITDTNLMELLAQYYPVTRHIELFGIKVSARGVMDTLKAYCNNLRFKTTMKCTRGSSLLNIPILFCPVTLSVFGDTFSGITDSSGEAFWSLGGVPYSSSQLQGTVSDDATGAPEIASDTRAFAFALSDSFDLSLDAWSYKKLSNTTVADADLVTPSTDNDDLLAGRGYLVYTPAINPEWVDMEEYTIECEVHYRYNYQRIMFGTLNSNKNNLQNGLSLNLNDFEGTVQDTSTSHTVTFKFLEGIVYVYWDDTYTGRNYDFTSTEDMIYLCMYNTRADSTVSLTEVSVDNTVDIDTPPTGGGAMINLPIDLDLWTGRVHVNYADNPNKALPSWDTTNLCLDSGRYYYSKYTDYTIDSETRNKRITVHYNLNMVKSYQIWFADYNITEEQNPQTNNMGINTTSGAYNTGNHTLIFECDNTGTWSIITDNIPLRRVSNSATRYFTTYTANLDTISVEQITVEDITSPSVTFIEALNYDDSTLQLSNFWGGSTASTTVQRYITDTGTLNLGNQHTTGKNYPANRTSWTQYIFLRIDPDKLTSSSTAYLTLGLSRGNSSDSTLNLLVKGDYSTTVNNQTVGALFSANKTVAMIKFTRNGNNLTLEYTDTNGNTVTINDTPSNMGTYVHLSARNEAIEILRYITVE